ncbi:MAG TPA: hypothetical protein VFL42_05085 [Terriglobales bacterium]|nr:hypothetical protein [Terriglobales bacterium]
MGLLALHEERITKNQQRTGNCPSLHRNYLQMPKFTALVYARKEDALYLDRALESLKVANDRLLINADVDPEIKRIARRHHARQKFGIPGVTPGAYEMDGYHHWILVLRPSEALSNDLIRSLEQWKKGKKDESRGYAFALLRQNGTRWLAEDPELRLVNRHLINWIGELPENQSAPVLPGPLLQYETDVREQRIAS